MGTIGPQVVSYRSNLRFRSITSGHWNHSDTSVVAGVRLDTGGWIRPVSSDAGEALLREQYETACGHVTEPLDTIRLNLKRQRPKYNQPENWVIGNEPWEFLGTELGKPQVLAINAALQREGYIFSDPETWTSKRELKERPVFWSLTLIQPSQLDFWIKNRDSDPQPRAEFVFNGNRYDLPITDPSWRTPVKSGEMDSLPSPDIVDADKEILFTISLGEAFERRCYKIVAAIFTMPSSQLVKF